MNTSEQIYFFIIFGAGLWLVVSGLLMHTRNMKSAMFFKVIPFLLGMGAIVSISKLYGFI